MKFVFITQQDGLASYAGPSGITYTIEQGAPFKVDNKLDIAFFKKNTRFKKAGLKDKKEVSVEPEEELTKKLDGIDGLSKTTIKKVVEIYGSISELENHIMEKYDFDPAIPKKQVTILIKTFKGE